MLKKYCSTIYFIAGGLISFLYRQEIAAFTAKYEIEKVWSCWRLHCLLYCGNGTIMVLSLVKVSHTIDVKEGNPD